MSNLFTDIVEAVDPVVARTRLIRRTFALSSATEHGIEALAELADGPVKPATDAESCRATGRRRRSASPGPASHRPPRMTLLRFERALFDSRTQITDRDDFRYINDQPPEEARLAGSDVLVWADGARIERLSFDVTALCAQDDAVRALDGAVADPTTVMLVPVPRRAEPMILVLSPAAAELIERIDGVRPVDELVAHLAGAACAAALELLNTAVSTGALRRCSTSAVACLTAHRFPTPSYSGEGLK